MSPAAGANVIYFFQVEVKIPDPVLYGTRATEREDDQFVRVVESKEAGDIAHSRAALPGQSAISTASACTYVDTYSSNE